MKMKISLFSAIMCFAIVPTAFAQDGMDHSNMEGMDHSMMGETEKESAKDLACSKNLEADMNACEAKSDADANFSFDDCLSEVLKSVDSCKKTETTDHSMMNGMDHSNMDEMDHSKMEGMDHSNMDKMDHSKMKGMDHSNMEKMDHSKMKGMDHSNMGKTDHSKMNGMDHSNMGKTDHSKMKGMDHSNMAGMDHSNMAPSIPVSDGSLDVNVGMPFPGAMHMEDDPLLVKVVFDALERGFNKDEEEIYLIESDAWIGKDLNKIRFKTEIEIAEDEIEEAELQILYSRAVSPYWDVNIGARRDFKPEVRDWAVLGIQGTAPFFVEVDANLFIGTEGQVGARLGAEYELMLTQKTQLVPEVEMNFYGQNDPVMGNGSGLSDLNLSLRLKHEVRREFAPYVGVNYYRKFGKAADFAIADGEKTSEVQFAVGFSAWF